MGLTIHYKLAAKSATWLQAGALVEALRQRALDLPFSRVGELVELMGADCEFQNCDSHDPNRWLLIQARKYVNRDKPAGGGCSSYEVLPTHVIAFSTLPGDGCEEANFGLCRYPATIEITPDPSQPNRKQKLRTGFSGWFWGSFCKTQYASKGGVANFLRCHLLVIQMLDHAKALGILDNVCDESGYWEHRDPQALGATVGQWNEMIAAFFGRLKDKLGDQVVSPISKFSDFEHLEANGRQREEKNKCPSTCRLKSGSGAAFPSGWCPSCAKQSASKTCRLSGVAEVSGQSQPQTSLRLGKMSSASRSCNSTTIKPAGANSKSWRGFLQKHGISYRRRSDSKWEYDAEIVEFRPGLGTVSYPTNSTGQPFVLLASLIAVDEALSKARLRLRQGLVTNPAAALRQVQGLLREQLPPRVPDLKPFEIPGVQSKVEISCGQ